jgi:hypothetical protein
LEEHGVAQDFIASAATEPGVPFTGLKLRPLGQDPPDCELRDAAGRRVAIEITELVDRKTVELIVGERRRNKDQTPPSIAVEWTSSKVLTALGERLTRKDFRDRLKDGPYDEYIVVIYTAEPGLDSVTALQVLECHRFDPPKGINRAYFSLDYEPGLGHPLIRLMWPSGA